MTRFNPEKNNKTPQEWSEVALKATQENHLQWNVIGGIVLGALAASTASPITGGLVVGYFLWDSWKKAGEIQRNQAAVAELGCVAQVLDGDNFADYAKQVGKEAVLEELEFAASRGLAMSNASADFYEDNAIASPASLMATAKTLLEKAGLHPQSPTAVIDRYDPTATAKIDIITEMSDRVSNTIVVGIPGSGKGMLISNAIRAVKEKHPTLKVFLIDPKDDPKEAGYFDCCDVVKPYACMDAKPGTVAAWAESAFDEYAIYAQKNERTLLIVDEGTMLGNKLQQAKSTLLVDKLTSYTSGGDSAGRNVWFMMQSPYVGGASLNLSTTSQMTSIVIAFSENIGAIAQWKSAKIFKQLSLDAVSELIENSTTGRAVYYGKTGKWYMMPELKNYSGYDRDKREYLPGFSVKDNVTSNNASEKSEDSFHANTDNESISKPQLSELAERILSFFGNAKNKEPKTLTDIKKKDELREHGDIKLTIALTELVNAGHLVFDGKDSWSKSDW
jgi:hypothetical protein